MLYYSINDNYYHMYLTHSEEKGFSSTLPSSLPPFSKFFLRKSLTITSNFFGSPFTGETYMLPLYITL